MYVCMYTHKTHRGTAPTLETMAAQPDQGRDKATKRVIDGLKRIYKETILPLEQARRQCEFVYIM